VAKQSAKPKVQKILLAVRAKVREGHSLAAALSDYPTVFPEIYRKTIQAGEATGHLDTILERLADYTEMRHQVRQTITNAMFYPILLTIIAFGIIIAMLTYVVPEVVQIFDTVQKDLPPLTDALITISKFMRTHWIVLLFGTLSGIILLILFFRRPGPKYALHATFLRLPLIGKFSRTHNAAQFGRTLSILTGSAVPIVDALNISAQVINNRPMRSSAERAAAKVREGSSINQALEQSGYFPPITLSLIASGEASGKLDTMLGKAADIQEREIQSMTKTLLSLFEPLMILFMGLVILVIVMALLLPIFELNTLVQ
jgi:general secretion pathway protein F